MPVTKQVYTLTPTWTAANLATALTDMLTDAGYLPGGWFDSFLSGSIENRIMEVTYGAGAYGKTYYWFMITTTEISYAVATGWNATTHVPVGTQYLDWYSNVTNATTNHHAITPALSTAATAQLIRYTSQVNTQYSWFTTGTVSSQFVWRVAPGGSPLHSWFDLTKGCFLGFHDMVSQVTNQFSFHSLYERQMLRREFLRGSTLAASTSLSRYRTAWGLAQFISPGLNTAATDANSNTAVVSTSLVLPMGLSSINPGFGANFNPVYSGLALHPYINEVCPSDFGIGGLSNSVAVTARDVMIVSAGTEEWEFLSVGSIANPANNQAGLLARVVCWQATTKRHWGKGE